MLIHGFYSYSLDNRLMYIYNTYYVHFAKEFLFIWKDYIINHTIFFFALWDSIYIYLFIFHCKIVRCNLTVHVELIKCTDVFTAMENKMLQTLFYRYLFNINTHNTYAEVLTSGAVPKRAQGITVISKNLSVLKMHTTLIKYTNS